MKRMMCLIMAMMFMLSLSGCGNEPAPSAVPIKEETTVSAEPEKATEAPSETVSEPDEAEEAPEPETEPAESGKALVAYFSCTGTTKAAAETVNEIVGGDMFEIVPAQPYTKDDLNYNTDCRANSEQNDDAARPEIASAVENMSEYDAVYLGFPIWWGKCPKIILTFLESYDFSGKTIVPFCTSGSSPFNGAGLSEAAVGAEIKEGRRLNGATAETVRQWLDDIGMTKQEEIIMERLMIEVNGNTLMAKFAENSSAQAFKELLKKGPVTVDMHDYGNFEKVGRIGTTLPQNDEQITTEPGDVILYQGDKITIYYAPNTYSFTRLAKIENVPSDLKAQLGEGEISVKFSLTAG